jgi:hypothetical protein
MDDYAELADPDHWIECVSRDWGERCGRMSDARVLRWCALAGVLTAAALAIAVLVPGVPPAPDSSAATVSSWVIGHRTALQAASILTPFTLFFGVFFLSGLYSLLRAGRRNSEIVPGAVILAGLATLLLPMTGAIAEGALAYPAASAGSVALNRFAFDVLSIAGVVAFIPAAAMTGAASLQGGATGVFPPWLVWLGWIYVPAGLLGSVSSVSDNRLWFFVSGAALFLLGVWILGASWAMWNGGKQRPPTKFKFS